MKKFTLIFLVLSTFALAACAPVQEAVQKVVVLPDELQIAITSLFVFAVGWAFAQIGNKMPWFTKLFGQYADDIAFALSGTLIGLIQSWLDMIPPMWETVGNLFLALIVAVLAALQLFRFLGKLRVKTFRA
jgi:uncharacterized protein YacL